MDIGATATRALVVDATGHRRGAGRSAGGNPTAHRPEVWTGAISDAVGQALAEAGPVTVGSVVAGVAGSGALADGDTAASFERAIRAGAGCACGIRVTSDLVVAFSAGTPEPDGTILVAGTGAAAAAIRGRSPVRVVDGHGWLLGDGGSGFWAGREAVRAALADLDGRGPPTSLRCLVAETLLGRDAGRDLRRDPGRDGAEMRAWRMSRAIVQAVHARPPVELSALAPLVSRCASEGDQVAAGIARNAAGQLLSAVKAVRAPAEDTPIVLTGGVAAGDHMVALLLRQGLDAHWPGSVRLSRDGVAGAAWLALASLPAIEREELAELHRALIEP